MKYRLQDRLQGAADHLLGNAVRYRRDAQRARAAARLRNVDRFTGGGK